jgi:hypothetical protein
MDGLGFGRPRTDEQIVRDSVAEELGPFFREAPMEQVDDAFTALGRTDGGEDLLRRLEASGPRAEYSIDLPGNTQPLTQDVAARGFFPQTGPRFPDGGLTPIGLPERIPGGMSADLGPGIPAGPPPRGFPAPFAEPRGLVPQGPRGLVPQERGLIPQRRELSVPEESLGDAPLRLEGPEQLRLEGPRQPRLEGPEQLRIEGPQRARIEGPGVSAERNAMDDLADAVNADAARRKVPRDGDFRFDAGQRRPGFHARNVAKGVAERLPPAVAGGLATALGVRFALEPGSLGDSETMAAEPEPYRPVPNVMRPPRTTADLAAEQNPPPSVMTEGLGPREQAHALQRKLNDMRAEAGGEVPEAVSMKREIQRLFDMSDSQTNAAARQGVAPAGVDPLSQARGILADLNAGRIPPAQRGRAQAEMQRLYREADAQANARTSVR